MEKLLKWVATQGFHSYSEESNTIFYLRGSSNRFSSKEVVSIFENKMKPTLEKKWNITKRKNEIYKTY